MNAVEIRGLTKNFAQKQVLCGLDMTVPVGSVYGLIGENGSGKSTTEKIICGLLPSNGGTVRLFGKSNTDADIRANMGVLIEAPGCFPNFSVWDNMKIHASHFHLKKEDDEIRRILKLVRMEGAAGNRYKNCSLGMKQRIGIAMALLGSPQLLIVDEPLNGLDADGMRIMRELFTDLAQSGHTLVISSHLLGELEKVATHYGILRHGKMIRELTAEELDADCRRYVALRTAEMSRTKALLMCRYARVEEDESGMLRVYGADGSEEVVWYLYENGILPQELCNRKIGLEEYYLDMLKGGR